jgi:hypothetical protein
MAPKKKTPKKSKKKSMKPKKSAKKAASSKTAARKKAPLKKAPPAKKSAKNMSKSGGRGRSSAAFEPKGSRVKHEKKPVRTATADLPGANHENADELLDDGSVFEVEIVEGVEEVSDADLSDLKPSETPDDDSSEEY